MNNIKVSSGNHYLITKYTVLNNQPLGISSSNLSLTVTVTQLISLIGLVLGVFLTSFTCIVKSRKRGGFSQLSVKGAPVRYFATFYGNLRGFLEVKRDCKNIL